MGGLSGISLGLFVFVVLLLLLLECLKVDFVSSASSGPSAGLSRG